MRPDSFDKRLHSFGRTWALALCFGLSSFVYAKTTKDKPNPESNAPVVLTTQIRWGSSETSGGSAEITAALDSLFASQSQRINFAKRDLVSLLEEALPRSLGKLFPFRRAHKIPDNFVFENFGRKGFLVGELNTRVPPIFAGTDTADWLEIRSAEAIPLAREFTTVSPANQGIRALGLQKPLLAEIFTTGWIQPFDAAAAIVENGGLKCWNTSQSKKPYQNLTDPGAHVRCSTPVQQLTLEATAVKQLPRKVGSASVAPVQPPSGAGTLPTCTAMGRLSPQSLELLGDEKAGHCLLWRNSRDERFLQKGTVSDLICLNARHKSFQKTRFHSVVAILPSTREDTVHVFESEDDLLTSYRLNLVTLSVKKEDVTVPSGQNLRSIGIPTQRTGMYACQQSAVPPPQGPSAEDPLTSQYDWIYVDDAVYGGLRPLRGETDVAWRVRIPKDGAPEAERLSWTQLQYDHPSVTNERPFACVASRELDSRCGLRVLQTSMQLSEEWLNGDFHNSNVSSAVQLSAALIITQSLEKVMVSLPDWSLRAETEELLSVYKQKIKQLLEGTSFIQASITLDRPVREFPLQSRYMDLPADSQDYTAIKKLLSPAEDFWALLKQKSL